MLVLSNKPSEMGLSILDSKGICLLDCDIAKPIRLN